MIAQVHSAGRAPLTWSIPPGVSGKAELDEEVTLPEPPELAGAMKIEKKRGFPWKTLAPAVLVLGGAVTGHLTGHLTFPTVLRWSGDEMLADFDRMAELGQFSSKTDYYKDAEPISPGDALARLNDAWGDPKPVTFTFSDDTSVVFRSRTEVEFAHDFLFEGQHPGFTGEQVELIQRISRRDGPGQPGWDSRGVGAMLALQRGQELTYSFPEGNYWDPVHLNSADDLHLLGELYFGVPSSRVTPGQRDAMVELTAAKKVYRYDASNAYDFYQAIAKDRVVRVQHEGGILPTTMVVEVGTLEQAEEAWEKVRNQVESDRYAPSSERLARASEPVIARYDALVGGLAGQLESVAGLTGVPQDKVSAKSHELREVERRVDRLGELLSEWRPEHREEAQKLLESLSPPAPRERGQWWNPWTEEHVHLMNGLKTQVQQLIESQDRPAAPEGWTPPLPNLEGF